MVCDVVDRMCQYPSSRGPLDTADMHMDARQRSFRRWPRLPDSPSGVTPSTKNGLCALKRPIDPRHSPSHCTPVKENTRRSRTNSEGSLLQHTPRQVKKKGKKSFTPPPSIPSLAASAPSPLPVPADAAIPVYAAIRVPPAPVMLPKPPMLWAAPVMLPKPPILWMDVPTPVDSKPADPTTPIDLLPKPPMMWLDVPTPVASKPADPNPVDPKLVDPTPIDPTAIDSLEYTTAILQAMFQQEADKQKQKQPMNVTVSQTNVYQQNVMQLFGQFRELIQRGETCLVQ